MGYKRETVVQLSKFRQNMGSDLYQETAKKIFKSTIIGLPVFESNPISEKKLQYAETYLKYLKVLNLVTFIGVTGSVSNNFAKDKDDIDYIVVVKNNTMWIYRGLMLFKNLFNNKFRKSESSENKDLICVNLITEERGLLFDNDLFNLNELYHIKPVFNESFYENILASNQWLKEWGGVINKTDSNLKDMNIFLEAINLYFFLPQIIFMIIKGHKPELKRILSNYLKGRIEFFRSDYKYEKLKPFKTV
jgi:hypothetical protein